VRAILLELILNTDCTYVAVGGIPIKRLQELLKEQKKFLRYKVDWTLMRLLATLMLLAILVSCNRTDYSDKKNRQRPLTNYPGAYIDTESKFIDSTGIVVVIQNSVPRGLGYTDPAGKYFDGRIFWTRVINETDTPLELTINFPADSFAILPSADAYLKVFLPLDTMTSDKETLYGYGATGLKSFLDSTLNKPTLLQRTINPKEACLFHIGMLFYRGGGVARAGLVLEGQDLFYRINLLGPALIPCGRIVVKKIGQ
jgi:hypothetical protein